MIVSTNAAPMNELVLSYFGLGASIASKSVQHFAEHKYVDVASLTSCIDMVMQTPLDVLVKLGGNARDAYLKSDTDFTNELISILKP